MMAVAWPGLLAFALALALTPAVKALARRAGVVASPKADRWHRTQVPLLGGVAIVLAVVAAVIASRPASRAAWAVLAGAAMVAAAGLVDDLRPLRPQTKLLLQVVVAAVLVAFGVQFRLTDVPVLDQLITLVWLVGITNAFNLLDNMDGLAAGIAAVVAGFRLVFFLADGDLQGAAFAGALLGGCLGFLVYNFNPASVFMGDTGSLFLGFMTAGLSLVGEWAYSRGTFSVMVLPVLVVLVPIFDTTFVTIARMLAGRPVSQGGRDHTSHRLVALGMSERRAVLTLYALALLGGSIALFSYRYGLSYGVVLAVLLVLATGLLGVFLGRLQVYPEGIEPSGSVATLLSDFPYKRQVATVVIDMILVVLAYYAAYLLRFEDRLVLEQQAFQQSLPVVVLCQALVFVWWRSHQGIWRHTGVPDLLRLGQSVLLGTTMAVLVILYLFRFEGFSRAVFVLHSVLLFLLLAASRISFRALDQLLRSDQGSAVSAVVYGAGKAGEMVLREVAGNPALGWRVVAFMDDDRGKRGTRLQGVLVAGGLQDVKAIVAEHRPELFIVSSSKISVEHVRLLSTHCTERSIRVVRAAFTFESLPPSV